MKSPGPVVSSPFPAVAILGAGITGLTAAWHLRQAGVPVVVFEAGPRCGGAIETLRDGDWLHEGGPNSLLEDRTETAGFIEQLGLAPRRLYAAAAARNRYVLKGGRPVAMPATPGQFLRTGIFSLRAKLRLAGEPLRRRRRETADETVAEFTVRRLGREFLDYAVDPFVGGVYAGDPSRLSVRHAFPRLHALEREHGSLIRGAIRRRAATPGPAGRILSFPDGLQELPRALAAPLGESLRLRTRVVGLQREQEGWRVTFERAGSISSESFAAVIAALPAGVLAGLKLAGCGADPGLACLAEIEHPPIASVFTGYRRGDIAHPLDGFGLLVPRIERRNILGTLFSSTLFPGRAPAGHVALTTFVGGSRQPELALADHGALTRLVRAELGALLGARAAPVFVSVRRHPHSIPQYVTGYDRFETACARVEATAPGFFIGGNGRDGVSLSACLASGRRLARAAADALAAGVPARSVP